MTSSEPIAVVGMGCRFAGGADSPAAFWELLLDGRDGIGEMPQDRWAAYRDRGPDFEAALRRATAVGAWLPDVSGFDAAFFGLTPREAELMDPQQRLLLEVAWEALEHAGVPARELAGSDTGVFVGVGSDDYARRLLEDLPGIEAWTGIGGAMCAVANRISYALDLRGPSIAVDTACSASLAATHLACQSLRERESTIALVGGVNLMISPGLVLTLDAAGATAPDGRSKPFGSGADGYGRGEGAGVLVLKRLGDAERDGDRVLAVIRGSAVQQDGRTNGIMAPNGDAQRHLLAETCRRAGVDPGSVDYVEAHGTGTRLGDPLEAGALAAVYGRARPDGDPLLIGSAKSNIGHLEAGAGVAALIKATLALHDGRIPASLHFGGGNPGIDWSRSNVRVVTATTPWPDRPDRPRRAGVSGFGYGGTIGHVVLEQAPAVPTGEVPAPPGERVYPLSAAGPEALRAAAAALADRLSGTATGLADTGHTLAHRRSHLEHRATVTAADRDTLVQGLRSIASGEPGPRMRTGVPPAGTLTGPVWVFSGHGSQWPGMGRELLLTEPVFASAIDELEPVFLEEIGFSPRQALIDGDFATVDRIQTLIFAVQIGLAAMWRAAGVTPAAVIGHSVGEIAAAVVAGALSVADGARLICRRSILLRRVAGAGAMAMVSLSFEEVEKRLTEHADVVAAIAASPLSTVVSGSPAAIADIAAAWEKEDLQVRRVGSDVAFHSPQMDAIAGDLAAAAATLRPVPAQVRIYTTALADPRAEPLLDGAYWAANLRRPVRLAAAVAAAAADGHRAFVEISAHPVVAHSIGETLAEHGVQDAFVGSSLRRDQPQLQTLLTAVADAYVHGVRVDWSRLQPTGALADLPTYAWQRQPHWRESTPASAAGRTHDPQSHTLLGSETRVAGSPTRLWRTTLTEENRPYPGSHRINGTEIVPAAVLINTFLTAAGPGHVLDRLSLRLPVIVGERSEIQVVNEGAVTRLAVGDEDRLVHAEAGVRPAADAGPATLPDDRDTLAPADPGDVERLLAAVGVPTMGFPWRVCTLHRAAGVLRAEIETGPVASWAPMLDAALSAAPSVYPGAPRLRMVAGAAEIRLGAAPPERATVRVTLDGGTGLVEVCIADAAGTIVGRIAGLRYAGMEEDAVTRPAAELVHQIGWRAISPQPAAGERGRLLVAGDPDRAERLRDALAACGADAVAVPFDQLASAGTGDDVLLLIPDGQEPPEAAAVSAWALTRSVQQLADRDGVRLWCATTGVREGRDAAALAQAGVWGVGRVLAQEHEDIWGGVVDLPADAPEAVAQQLVDVIRACPGEEVISLRGHEVMAARLRRAERKPSAPAPACRPDGTYLVTGGLGALGLLVANHLAERGARRLVLAGRRGLPPRSAWDAVQDPPTRTVINAVRALESRGVTVRVLALDVANAEQCAQLLDPEALGLPPVRGIVHAAGVLDNRMATSVDEDSIRAVLRPKVAGAWVLHELFPPGTLDFFVLFSSCGQLLGMPGQTAYGAANAFLDALAAHRPDVLSLGWTSWQGQGMAVNEVVDRELAARGVGTISAVEAFAAWDFAACRGPGHYPVLKMTGTGTREPLPLLRDLATAPAPAGDEATAADDDPLATATSPEELRERLRVVVGSHIATEMRMPVAGLDVRRSLIEQGLDSVMTIVIRKGLEKRFGRRLPAMLLWHQPTVTAIADHLAGLLEQPEPVPAASAG